MINVTAVHPRSTLLLTALAGICFRSIIIHTGVLLLCADAVMRLMYVVRTFHERRRREVVA